MLINLDPSDSIDSMKSKVQFIRSADEESFIKLFQSYFLSQSLVDVTIFCEGKSLKAHKIILSASSPYFKELIRNSECKHPVIFLDGIKYKDLLSLVHYMYYGELEIFKNDFNSLLDAAESLKILGFVQANCRTNSTNSSCTHLTENNDESQPTSTLMTEISKSNSESSSSLANELPQINSETSTNEPQEHLEIPTTFPVIIQNDEKTFVQAEEIALDNEPMTNENNKRIEIGLQVDVDIPDVYYFAGGRHVSSETDFDPTYTPLEKLPAGSFPIPKIYEAEDDDNNESQSIVQIIIGQNNEIISQSSNEIISSITKDKSSSTQLSALPLENETNKESENEIKAECLVNHGSKDKSEKLTFADKAKTGALLSNSQLASNKTSKLNQVTKTTVPRTKTQSTQLPVSKSSTGTKNSTLVNYRSNIASRCRTAVNKGQTLTFAPANNQVSKLSVSVSTSSSGAPPKLSSSRTFSALQKMSSSPLPSSISKEKTNFHHHRSDNSLASSKIENIKDCTNKNTEIQSHVETTTLKLKPQLGPPVTNSLGIRSKSMIQPSAVVKAKSNQKQRSIYTMSSEFEHRKSFDGKNNQQIPLSNAFASIPDRLDTKKNSIGDDGWETVRSRNRSKWSLSSRSSSNNDLPIFSPNSTKDVNKKVDTKETVLVKSKEKPSFSSSDFQIASKKDLKKESTTIIKSKLLSNSVVSSLNGTKENKTKKSESSAGKNKPVSEEQKDLKNTINMKLASISQEKTNKKNLVDSKADIKTISNKLESQTTSGDISHIDEDVTLTSGTVVKSLKTCGNGEWKDTEEADEKRILEKEEALDSAIREEEMIEQELLQVEKDFEEIENGGGSVVDDISEGETLSNTPDVGERDIENESLYEKNSPSPPSSNEPDEDFFFIDILNENNTPSSLDEIRVRESKLLSIREKLMSPAKERDSAETLRKHQDRLAKAERNRERLLKEKFKRYVELSERFQDINETTKKLVEERAELIARSEERRKRAVEKREQNLQDIKKKAHDEESKAKEIAFINALGEEIKKINVISSAQVKEQELDGRLQILEEERKIKLEERGAKLNAVLERQSRNKYDWQAKLSKLQEKSRQAQERILREKQEKAKERSELALKKTKKQEERKLIRNAAHEARKAQIKNSLDKRLEDTTRRHEENMEQKRQKAIELSVLRVQEEKTIRICTLCNVLIQSEVQELGHLRGRLHVENVIKMEGCENFGLKFMQTMSVDKMSTSNLSSDKGRVRTVRKLTKKLNAGLIESGREWESGEKSTFKIFPKGSIESKTFGRTQRNIKEIERILGLLREGINSSTHLSTIERLLASTKKLVVRNKYIQDTVISMGIIRISQEIFDLRTKDLPHRILSCTCDLLVGVVYRSLYNSLYVLRSSFICTLLELAIERWNILIPETERWYYASSGGNNEPLPTDTLLQYHALYDRTLDIISYIVSSGLIDRISVYCRGVRGPIDSEPYLFELIQVSLEFLIMIIYSLNAAWDHKKEDITQLLVSLESSELAGMISMSYSLLLHQGAPTRPRLVPHSTHISSLSNNTFTNITNNTNTTSPTSTTTNSTSSNNTNATSNTTNSNSNSNNDINGNGTTESAPPLPGLKSARLVLATLSLVNAYMKLDINSMQRALGSEAVSLQFRHIASQLLWQVVPHTSTDIVWNRLINELLMAIGNFTLMNKENQAKVQSGQTPTVLQQLCCLPKKYFTDAKESRFLFPTLIAATFGSPENQQILAQQKIPIEDLQGFMRTDFAKINPICKLLLPHCDEMMSFL